MRMLTKALIPDSRILTVISKIQNLVGSHELCTLIFYKFKYCHQCAGGTPVIKCLLPLMDQVSTHMYIKWKLVIYGKKLSSLAEFEWCLKDLKAVHSHPLCIFNSQTAKNQNSKHPTDHMDEERHLYTYQLQYQMCLLQWAMISWEEGQVPLVVFQSVSLKGAI